MGNAVCCGKNAIQVESVPIILQELYSLMAKDQAQKAIEMLDQYHISNEMAKEHLMDLCMNKKTQE